MTTTKRCFRCGADKPTSDFYRHPEMGDGRLGKCKECTKSDVRANRRLKHEEYCGYDRMRDATPERRKMKLVWQRNHRIRNPGKASARDALLWAIETGKIERQPCSVCGCKKSEGHHADYSRPLDVKWLCRVHHMEEHGKMVSEHTKRVVLGSGLPSQTSSCRAVR